MAEKAYVLEQVRGFEDFVNKITWSDAAAADTFQAVNVAAHTLKSVQIGGTFDSATVVIQGSLDGTTYFTLSDLAGSAISKTSAALEGIQEHVVWIKPATSGGGVNSAVDVVLVLK